MQFDGQGSTFAGKTLQPLKGCHGLQDAANRGSVKTVQIKGPNTDWQTLNNVWGASWETGQVPETPLDFRIQDDMGVDVSLRSHLCDSSVVGAYCRS